MPGRALVVTARDPLAASVGRLAALAGVGCARETDSTSVRAAWRQASSVFVGGDVVIALAAAGLPRHPRVVVVAEGEPDSACWQAALALGAHRVLALPAEESAVVEELRASDRPTAGDGRVVGVLGGCGGAGASTFAAGLALAASSSTSALLVDGDPVGGGLDVLLGGETADGLRWGDLARTRGRLDPASFAAALVRVGPIAVLAWGRQAGERCEPPAVDAVIEAAKQAFPTVVIDLPRAWDPVADRLLDAVDATVLLVPAEVRPVAATASLLVTLGDRVLAPHLVVRDVSRGGLSAREVGGSLGLEVAATLRSDPDVRRAARRGELPVRRSRGPLAAACAAVLSAIEGS